MTPKIKKIKSFLLDIQESICCQLPEENGCKTHFAQRADKIDY